MELAMNWMLKYMRRMRNNYLTPEFCRFRFENLEILFYHEFLMNFIYS